MIDDDDDDDWPEAEPTDDSGAALLAVSYFDSLAEMRASVAEAWQELRWQFGEASSPPLLRALAFKPEYLALRVQIDAGLECAVLLYPVIGGRHYPEWGEGGEALFQLSDDGRGAVDPEQLWALFEFLLDDMLPLMACDNRDEVLERFAGGQRPLAFCDPSGSLLVMPGDGPGGFSC